MISIMIMVGKTVFGMAALALFFWAWFRFTEWMDDHEEFMAFIFLLAIAAVFIGIGGLLGHGLYEEIFG